MKGIMKLFPAALALVALASCSNDDLFEKSASQAVNGKTMEASIEDFSVATRAAFAENKTDGKADKRALVWTAGDSYKVYGELATPDKYTLQNASAGKANGTFDLMTDDYNENPAFAVFPYDKIDADRASSKLTVTLSDWTYATTEVKDEGYNQGGFVSNVPMFGKIGSDPKSAAFGYMTAILRVDLAKLPKRTTRLILVTDRPLTGTFETEFDANGAYPEIVSPAGVDTEKDHSTDVDKDGNAEDAYIMAIATDPVSQRTNKTFFIAVPTGNKYDKFDIYVEYNMAGSTQVELVDKLGNSDRKAAGKSVLNWQRGKVKSLAKEITVTANGNTPKALAAFLASEWKTFPADQDINITVADAAGNLTGIDLAEANPGDNDFTIPAELKDRVVNIIIDESVTTDGYINATGKTMNIVDEDNAPVASKALRLINFCVPTAANEAITINAPETQVSFTVPEGKTAKYKSITATVTYGDMTQDAAGLTVGEGVNVSSFVRMNDGSFLNAGTINNIRNVGDYTTKFTGDANKIISDAKGEVVVVEANTGDIDINEGALTITGLEDKSNTIGTISAKGTGAINVKNVDAATITPGLKFTGAVTIDNVNTFKTTGAIEEGHAAEVNISNVATSAFFGYKGTGKVTLNTVKGAGASDMIVVNQAKNAQPFTATNLSGSFDQVKYNGTGDVDVEGVDAGVTLLNDSELKGGAVTLKNIIGTTGKKINKTGKGALTIEGCKLETVDNAGGAINATGVGARKSIVALNQNGAGKITLNTMQDVTTLYLKVSADVDYVDTYIATLTGAAASVKSNIYGTKNSGVGQVTIITVTPTTDVWDGTSMSTTATNNIYTSASLARLTKTGTNPGATITQYLDLDMGNKAFGGINEASANAVYTSTAGKKHKISNLNGTLFKNWTAQTLEINNLELNTVAAANAAIMAQTGKEVKAKNLTVSGVTLSATSNAGGLIGIAKSDIEFTGVTVKNVTIANASTGKGTDINLGGFIGQVDNASATINIKGGNVETAAIKGHYYMGGFIGQVVNAKNVYIWDVDGKIVDKKGSQVKGVAFAPVSADGTWSTLKSGTIAPFIGGIKNIATTLEIYGKFDSFDRAANKWDMNFLSNEDFKFWGTKQDDCNFIGYIDISTVPTFKYYLKHVNGFEADRANGGMKIATTGDNGKTADDILATDCNVYYKQ